MILDSGTTTTHIAYPKKILDPSKYKMKPEPVVPGSNNERFGYEQRI
ncbi:MAG: hypothetical protein H6628_14830 [Calditrichae bacterium]|nr:hypothetical protein [Calditrichia bacterium]